jgi:uncharacterized protein
VDPDGDLFPCEKMIAQPEHRAGSVFEEASLAAVRSLPAMVRVRERTVQAIPECRGCDWRAFCGGGCPADVTAAGRGLLEPDPNCEFYRSIFETLITRLAGDETFLDRVYPTELRVRQSPRMQACEGGGGDGR